MVEGEARDVVRSRVEQRRYDLEMLAPPRGEQRRVPRVIRQADVRARGDQRRDNLEVPSPPRRATACARCSSPGRSTAARAAMKRRRDLVVSVFRRVQQRRAPGVRAGSVDGRAGVDQRRHGLEIPLLIAARSSGVSPRVIRQVDGRARGDQRQPRAEQRRAQSSATAVVERDAASRGSSAPTRWRQCRGRRSTSPCRSAS